MSKIELMHIDKFFGNNHVLKDLNLTIEDGDFMTLLGPSGCGKTTTLRIIAGLERPEHGNMLMNGKEIINSEVDYYAEPSKRGLNLVFQSYALWPHMTVYDNIAFGLKIKKLSSAEIKRYVMNALERMRMEEYGKRYPNELSGGQQQRVAIARAIAYSPELLLLDEPLSNLDAKLRIDMRVELKRLHQELGTTIIYVTHDQVEALTMSTKIAVFSKGCLSQLVEPMELYMNPIDLINADFIGNPRINFLDGKACKQGNKLKTYCSLGSYIYDAKDMTDEVTPTGEFNCIFGIRPEQVQIEKEPADGLIAATVYANQLAGSETLVTVHILDSQTGKSDEVLVKQIGIEDYRTGQKIYLKVKPDRFNVYSKESTRLIKYARI
ncbi:carbohydrate ABC transporter ATP-binding protein (CUT1 family) [Lachnotalea glycerini]|uniref:ABC transporter ATP-binding protein n=1 Tax=Lachnotalea glycerini TaxID=1763509 RepID=A0A255ISJ1_9FIRM|nr:ABC transporter ATP-binding protein [Lachnotalea glycerini]PXV93460.1 carbohydrate ABC transporter ATP-binding protein (CUT1 family) [Lachnotalea glycerini]RDY31811.1 ABC transporter ATP-binding protein [Lachnotalea glycerini]